MMSFTYLMFVLTDIHDNIMIRNRLKKMDNN